MSKLSQKRMVTFTAIISLISFAYKFGMGIYNMSLILMIASISTLLVFIAKVAFVKSVTKTRAQKRKGYITITIVTFIYVMIFILFSVLKAFGIDISNQKTYEGVFGTIFIAIIFVMFLLSLFKLRGALEKNDLIVIGLKEITFVSALTDLVIIEEFLVRTLNTYYTIEWIDKFTNYFLLGICAAMLGVVIFMIVRVFRYKVETK